MRYVLMALKIVVTKVAGAKYEQNNNSRPVKRVQLKMTALCYRRLKAKVQKHM